MESDKKYIDISFTKTQNQVALRLADVFTIAELESIDLNDAVIPEKRDINGMLVPIYIKSFEYDVGDGSKIIIVIDSILEDAFPIRRFHSINIYKGAYGVEIRCTYRENNLDYLAICIATAINYLKYGGGKRIINRRMINNSFIKELLSISRPETLKEALFILEYLNVNNAFIGKTTYNYVFYIDNIQIKISSYYTSCMRFSVDNGESKESYIYFVKNRIDISNLFMTIESAINNPSTP